MSRRLTTAEFIQAARRIHGNRYDYNRVQYQDSHRKIEIVCKKHGMFQQKPNTHLNRGGCRKCGYERNGERNLLTLKEFRIRAKQIHGERYNYDQVDYRDSKTKVLIGCPKHGNFRMKPNSHLLGQGCVRCGYESLGTRFRKRLEDFVREASRKHGDYYDYSDFIYQRNRVAGTIICAKHGKFEQTPKKHLMGQGCPACSSSNGENKVRRFLESKGIRFQTEVRLITGTRYSFDFVLSDSKVLVEFNGKQHYQPIKFFGGKKGFRRTQERDRFKAQWAAENGFELIVIPYWEFPNIDNILTERLFGLEKAA